MKNIFLSAVFLLAAIIGSAQAKVEIGLKGGLNLANVNTESATANYESATGYHGGAYGLVKVANIGIQPELLYSTRGTEVSFDGVSGDFKQEFTYLDIPIMLKLYAVAGLNVQVGPQFGVLLSTDGKISDGSGGSVEMSKDSYKNADMSAAFGVGWDAPFGLNFTARYILGLTDINDDGGGMNSSDEEAKNRTFQVSVGFRLFKLGN